MKLVIVALVALVFGTIFGIIVTAVLMSGKEEDELRERLCKEYEEEKDKE